jgi:outer membrane protein assembly factor BamB
MRICGIVSLLNLKLIFTTGILEADNANDLKWYLSVGNQKGVSEPAIGLDGIIYFSNDGNVYGVNAKSGETIWVHSHAIGNTFISPPSVGADGTVYVTAFYNSWNSANRGFYALNGWTGAKVWEFTPEEAGIMTYSPPVIGADNTIYFLAQAYSNYDPNWGTYTLYAFDGKTGKYIWKAPSESPVVALGFENDLYIRGKHYCLSVLDAKTGITKREFPDIPSPKKIPPVIDSDGTMYISQGGTLSASDVKAGKKLWEFEEIIASAPIIDEEGRLYATNNKTLYSINKKTGKKLWEFKTEQYFGTITMGGTDIRTCSPAISSDGVIYIGSGAYFFALDSESGDQLWKCDTSELGTNSARPTSPAIGADGTIYFGSVRSLYAFHGKSGPGLAPWPMFGQNAQRTHKALNTGKFPEYFTIQVDGNGGAITGSGTHRESDRIELKATAGQGNVFTGWSGDLEGDINPMEVEINADLNITANFSRSASNIPPNAGDVIDLISPDDATIGSTKWNWAAESKNILATSTTKGTNLYEVDVDGSVYYLSSIPVAPGGYGQCLSFSENLLVIGRESEAAYVYKIKSDQAPKFLAKLVGSKVEKAIDNSTSGVPGWFARNVVLSGNLLAISQHGEGAVYLYRISDDESVVFLGKVHPPSEFNKERFGESMSLFGDLMAVSTYSFGNPPTSETFLFRINFDGEITFLNSIKGIGNGGKIALSADFLAIRYDNLDEKDKAVIYQFDEDGSVISTQEITDLSGDEFTNGPKYRETISFQHNHLLIPPQIFELKSDGSFKPIDSGETNGFKKIANHKNSLGFSNSYYAFGTNFIAALGKVYFDPSLAKTVTISTAPLPNSGGSVSGGGQVFEGWDVTLKAKPSGMNKFIGWTGDFTGKDNPLTIKADKSKTLIANFAMTYEVIITSTSGGEVTGGGFIPENENTTLHAVPDLGYGFNEWSGDIKGKSNPLSITVDSAKIINASFIKDNADDDGDGLSNYSELITYQTSPDKKDTDGDWLTDKEEIEIGTDPKSSNAKIVDFIKEKLGSDMDHLHSQGMEKGINLVKSAPRSYKLFSEADINFTRANAYSDGQSEGYKMGKQSVLNDPTSFNLVTKESLDEIFANVDSTTTPYTQEWFFVPGQGWFWTKKNVFPYIYSREQNSWLYFKSGNEKPLFYNYQEMVWQVFE